MPILSDFSPDDARLAVLKDCVDNYGVGDENAQWPNNILSRQTVVYSNGTIARAGDDVSFAVDSDELDLCVRLANEAAALMEGEEVGMGSESGAGFSAFWICANGEEKAEHISENLIRARFGSTIFPPASIEIGPISEETDPFGLVFEGIAEMQEEAQEDGPEEAARYDESLEKWKTLVRWFASQPDFQDRAWVAIGDEAELQEVPEEQYPPGTEMTPCVLPRLMLGLTHGGSLCGLFGFVVQT